MDKTWINLNTLDLGYVRGVKEFIKFAFENNSKSNEVPCPCKECRNVKLVTKLTLGQHLIMNRILPSYTRWIFHGEDSSSSMPSNETNDSRSEDEMHDLVYDAFGVPPPSLIHLESEEGIDSNSEQGLSEETRKFFNFLKEAKRELYSGCPSKFSTLSFVVRLLHIKCLGGWTDQSFTMMLMLLKEAFP